MALSYILINSQNNQWLTSLHLCQSVKS